MYYNSHSCLLEFFFLMVCNLHTSVFQNSIAQCASLKAHTAICALILFSRAHAHLSMCCVFINYGWDYINKFGGFWRRKLFYIKLWNGNSVVRNFTCYDFDQPVHSRCSLALCKCTVVVAGVLLSPNVAYFLCMSMLQQYFFLVIFQIQMAEGYSKEAIESTHWYGKNRS